MWAVRIHCISLTCQLWGGRGWAVLQLQSQWAGCSDGRWRQPGVEQMAQARVWWRTTANQQCSVYSHNLWTLLNVCFAFMPIYAHSQRRWSCCLHIILLWPDGTCSCSFVSWMIKIVVQPHDTAVLTLLHVSSSAHGAWGVSFCINCYSYVIWVGKSATKKIF